MCGALEPNMDRVERFLLRIAVVVVLVLIVREVLHVEPARPTRPTSGGNTAMSGLDTRAISPS
jgi:hypothetical protein